jgi:hypothetical protein
MHNNYRRTCNVKLRFNVLTIMALSMTVWAKRDSILDGIFTLFC